MWTAQCIDDDQPQMYNIAPYVTQQVNLRATRWTRCRSKTLEAGASRAPRQWPPDGRRRHGA